MANLRILRQTLTGASTAFTFELPGQKFLVKNFSTSDYCLINFQPITSENEATSIKLPKQMAQLVLTNEHAPSEADTIYIKGTGEVEVQEILW